MSALVPQTGGAVAAVTTSSSSSSSYSVSSSSSSSFASSSSSASKVVKQSTTTVKSATSSTSQAGSSTSSSSSVNVKSSGISYADQIAGQLGLDVNKGMEQLKLRMNEEMSNINRDMFKLMPGTPSPEPLAITGPDFGQFLVKMDNQAIQSCIDKANDDRVKLNFDVTEFDSETIDIKTVGNKIEVHAKKKSKKGDEERSEEFSRVYEMPTQNDVDPSKVTSSIYKDGVLTIELPVADAVGETTPQ